MAKKDRELQTRRMPSGAQQYVREGRPSSLLGGGTSSQRRMNMLEDLMRASRDNPEAQRRLHEAFMDEARQGREEFAKGGMVRGQKPIQVAGKNFRGSF